MLTGFYGDIFLCRVSQSMKHKSENIEPNMSFRTFAQVCLLLYSSLKGQEQHLICTFDIVINNITGNQKEWNFLTFISACSWWCWELAEGCTEILHLEVQCSHIGKWQIALWALFNFYCKYMGSNLNVDRVALSMYISLGLIFSCTWTYTGKGKCKCKYNLYMSMLSWFSPEIVLFWPCSWKKMRWLGILLFLVFDFILPGI